MQRLIAFLLGVLIVASAAAQTGSLTLDWLPPTQYTDGMPLIINEQVIYRGPAPGLPKQEIDRVPAGVATYVDSGLFNGQYCYQVTATDALDIESLPSNEACGSVSVGGNVPRPNPPTNLTVQ